MNDIATTVSFVLQQYVGTELVQCKYEVHISDCGICNRKFNSCDHVLLSSAI
jgi:hypothetical protein